jgi:hypothetical protein
MAQSADPQAAWPTDLPADLRVYLERKYGPPDAIVQLSGGQSGAWVYRVRFSAESLIIKATPRKLEAWFYIDRAPALRRAGIDIPRLEWSSHEDEQHWLVLEDIATPLPRERWLADPAVMGTLRLLHSIPLPEPADLNADMFQPGWTEGMNTAAVRLLPEEHAAAALTTLERLRQRATSMGLFRHECLISGDPNPTNWGLRPDGTPVLFDWDRFGLGTPALDLGITVPGLGDRDAFRAVATAYLGDGASEPEIELLATAAGLDKAWSLAEYLKEAALGEAQSSPEVLARLRAHAHTWLDSLP